MCLFFHIFTTQSTPIIYVPMYWIKLISVTSYAIIIKKIVQSLFYHLEWCLLYCSEIQNTNLNFFLLDCKISFYGCQFRSIDHGCLFMILTIWALGTGWPKKFWTVVFNDLNGLKLPQWPQRPKMTSMAFNDLKCPKLPQMTSMAFGDLNGLK